MKGENAISANEDTKKFTLYLPLEMWKTLKRSAIDKETSLNTLILELIEREYGKEE